MFVEWIRIYRVFPEYAVCFHKRKISSIIHLHFIRLVRAVGSSCVQSDECGELGECSNKICVCKSNHKIIDSYDHFGRKIQTCMINGKIISLDHFIVSSSSSGIDQMRFDFILLLFVVIVRLVFA